MTLRTLALTRPRTNLRRLEETLAGLESEAGA